MPSTRIDRIDGLSTSLAIKAPVKAATTSPVSLTGAQTIDGVSCVADDRVLLMGQTDAAENGIYNVSDTSWSRAGDFDGARDVVQGTQVPVAQGTINAGKTFRITTANVITIGTTNIVFEEVTFSTAITDPELAAIQGLTSAADKVPYFTGSGTASLADFTSAGRAISGAANAAAQRTALGLGTAALAATGDFATAAQGALADSALQAGDSFSAPTLHIQDQKTANTAGGTFTSGAWQTRTLNTEVTDTIGSTLSSNQFTLPAGTYDIDAIAPAFTVGIHKAKLYNITDAADTIIGTSASAQASSSVFSYSVVRGRFTIAGTKTFEIRHQCQTTRATDGFGIQSNFGVIEVYTDVFIKKVA